MMLSRRGIIAGALATVPTISRPRAAGGRAVETRRALAALERRPGDRLGVAILDTATGELTAHRGDERFAILSTRKWIAAAFVLARIDRKAENLARRVPYAKADLVDYSPVTAQHVGEGGMTVGALCEAAVTRSDNTAANLLLDSFGGPAALTGFVRANGDAITRLDRREPELNDVGPRDLRDTTSPIAMAHLLRTAGPGRALSSDARDQLTKWLVANTTGDKRLRAGVPKDWRVGDKTGSNGEMANDVAIVWPPGRRPLIVAAYYVGGASHGTGNAVLAEVGRIAAAA